MHFVTKIYLKYHKDNTERIQKIIKSVDPSSLITVKNRGRNTRSNEQFMQTQTNVICKNTNILKGLLLGLNVHSF